MSISPLNSAAAVSASTLADPAARIRRLPADEQVKAAAGQFEAILLRQFLQESVGKLMNPGGDSAGGGMYGFMLTDALADKLAAAGGLGLGPVMARQLMPRGREAGKEGV